MHKIRAGLLSAAAVLVPLASASADEGYKLPPPDVVDIVTRAPSPSVRVSPEGDKLLLLERESLPPVSELGKPMERLAGLRLDAATNDRHGPRTYVGITVKDVATGEEQAVNLPEGADIDSLDWSPDGSMASFTNTRDNGVDLWVLDVDAAKARKVATDVNPVFGVSDWMPDGKTLLVQMIPEDRGPMPERSPTPSGPAISEAAGGQEASTRTYQDLLSDTHDQKLFDWLARSEMALVDVSRRRARVKRIGDAAAYVYTAPSPNGEYILAERLTTPYSYEVPYYRFPQVSEVVDLSGEPIAIVAEAPLADNLPVQGVIEGPRSLFWHPTQDATLLYVEALDGGDPRVETDERDRVMALTAPFDTADADEIARLEDRYWQTTGLEGDDDVLLSEYDRDTREVRTSRVDVLTDDEPMVLDLRNVNDRYADKGRPLTTMTETGHWVARVADGYTLMSGSGATPEGDRPFLSRMDLQTGETEELWRNSGEEYETVVDVTSDDGSAFVTYYENPTTPGNFRLHDDDGARFITDFEDPHPELTGVKRELITYEREDGVTLSANLLLPPGYEEGDKLPVVVWAYPREFNSADNAGQVSGSDYRFTRFGGTSPRMFLTQGYALMENATMPVVGDDPETVNDTFIEQIVMSGQAAIDETVRRGFGDGERVGVAGHSYGAFMTANLLAHSDMFRAGIARSGAYNRTLTPFGFQSERRTFWESPETYYNLSPFMQADQINEPILLLHGEKDNNSGTYPMQSERMFAAVKGNGGTVRLVMLPHESHGYRGRENVLHALAEMFDWFDTYVKPEELSSDTAAGEMQSAGR